MVVFIAQPGTQSKLVETMKVEQVVLSTEKNGGEYHVLGKIKGKEETGIVPIRSTELIFAEKESVLNRYEVEFKNKWLRFFEKQNKLFLEINRPHYELKIPKEKFLGQKNDLVSF